MDSKEPEWWRDRKLVREHYNNNSTGYADLWNDKSSCGHLFSTRRRLVIELLSGIQEGDVLDVGCGPGVIASDIIGLGLRYYGVDISEKMLEEGAKLYTNEPRIEFKLAPSQNLPFKNESIDVVLCLGMLEYIVDIDEVFIEIARVLKPHGVFIFSMQNRFSPYRIAERMCRTWAEPCRQFSEYYANSLLEYHGFDKSDCLYYDFNLIPRPFDMRYSGKAVAISKRAEFLCRTPLKWLGTCFMIKASLGKSL